MDMVWVGYLAALLTSTAFIPQVVKSYRLRETKDLSLPMLLILAAGFTLWLCYGFVRGDPVLIASNSFSLTVDIVLTGMKLRYG